MSHVILSAAPLKGRSLSCQKSHLNQPPCGGTLLSVLHAIMMEHPGCPALFPNTSPLAQPEQHSLDHSNSQDLEHQARFPESKFHSRLCSSLGSKSIPQLLMQFSHLGVQKGQVRHPSSLLFGGKGIKLHVQPRLRITASPWLPRCLIPPLCSDNAPVCSCVYKTKLQPRCSHTSTPQLLLPTQHILPGRVFATGLGSP